MTETEMMLTTILNCKPIDLYVKPPQLTHDQKTRFDFMKKRFESGEPLQYVIGECDFIDTRLRVDPRVLIPRPETEIMADYARTVLDELGVSFTKKVLDLGTGSGNIPISLAKSLLKVHVTAVDISSKAIDLARYNAERNCVDEKITFVHQDMNTYLYSTKSANAKFDMVISNPPYIKTADLKRLPIDVQKEPVLALDGGVDGLDFYRLIIGRAGGFLKSKGILLLEIGDGQRTDIEHIFNQNKSFCDLQFLKDYRLVDRVAVARKV